MKKFQTPCPDDSTQGLQPVACSIGRFVAALLRRQLRCRRHRVPVFADTSCEDGSLLIEMAVALLVAIPLVFWMFELCMLTYTYSVLGDAARQGVRYAVVHGSDSGSCSGPTSGCGDSSGANVIAQVKSYAKLSFHDVSAMTVQVNYPDGSSSPPARVGVTIQYTYVPYIHLPGVADTVNLSAQGRIVY